MRGRLRPHRSPWTVLVYEAREVPTVQVRLLEPTDEAHLGQWLAEDAERLGLVDFDRYALGDPEFDLEPAVLDGFRAVAGEPDQRRLAVYTLHKLLGRTARAASALRPDAEARAARQLRGLRGPIAALARW